MVAMGTGAYVEFVGLMRALDRICGTADGCDSAQADALRESMEAAMGGHGRPWAAMTEEEKDRFRLPTARWPGR